MAVQVAPGRPLVFNHIPKTAGTSLIAALVDSLRPAAPFHGVDRSMFGPFTSYDQLSAAAKHNLVRSPADIPSDSDAVFGHIAPSTTRARFAGASSLTVLREPRTRLISHWLFSRQHSNLMLRGWGDWGEYVKASRRRLAEFLGDEGLAFYTDNMITRFLLWPSPLLSHTSFIPASSRDDVVEAALNTLRSFDFVRVVEDPQLTESLSSWLGREVSVQRSNESTAVRRGMECDVAAECSRAAELIEERTAVDAVLWREIASAHGVSDGVGSDGSPSKIFQSALARYTSLPRGPGSVTSMVKRLAAVSGRRSR